MTRQNLVRYGLKFNPFLPDIRASVCLRSPEIEQFIWRVENLARSGGFAVAEGEPGTGKSVALRLLAEQLQQQPDIAIRILSRPQCSVADFYRELGDLFGVEVRPHNRWAGTKALRARWREHLEAALFRAVLIIDEAQEAHTAVLSELRLLSHTELDSCSLLTVILCGDDRLSSKLRTPELGPLASRIRVRLRLEDRSPEQLLQILDHLLSEAGNPQLLSREVARTLCERAVGNLRVLMNMGAELLDAAVRGEHNHIDEKLFLETFGPLTAARARTRSKHGGIRVEGP